MKKLSGVMLVVASLFVAHAYAEDPPPFLLKWGTQGSGNGQFQYPSGIAVDAAGNVYVADYYNHRIQKFTPNGGFVTSWGSRGFGNGEFQFPSDVTVDVSGNVFIMDLYNNRVQKLNPNGVFLTKWGSYGSGDGQFQDAAGIAVDGSGNVYVADEHNHRIQKFTNSGIFLAKWGSYGSGDGQFNTPVSVAVDGSGNVYVSDYNNNRVQKFTVDGAFVTKWGSFGFGYGRFYGPVGIAVDASSNVYVTDYRNQRIQKFTSSGMFLTAWGSFGSGDSQFNGPAGVTVDASSNVYVADFSNHRIQKFGPGLGLSSVVLVHGYCSDASMWNDFATYLTQRGFTVYTISLVPKNGRPNELAAQLDDLFVNDIPGTDRVNVVAHSMGGLVSRYYIRGKRSESRIGTLITLGTPHHGSDLVSYAFKVKTATWLLRELFRPCKLTGSGLADLITGSQSLNKLNYGNENIGDKRLKSSKGTHAAEIVYDPNLKVWALAGTQNFLGVIYGAAIPAWATTPQSLFLQIQDYANDGVVGVNAARMYNNQCTPITDINISLPRLQHTPDPKLYFGRNIAYQNSSELFALVENLLRGGTPSSELLASENLITTEQVQSETVLSTLLSIDGVIQPAHTVDHSFVVPTTGRCRITMAADSAFFRLRKPGGMLLTPDDTLKTSWLHFVQDPAVGIGVYTIDNPQPGSWSAVIVAWNTVESQQYAASAEIITSRQVQLESSTAILYTPGIVQLRISLLEGGIVLLGTSWSVQVLRPDSTSVAVAAFDDGAHGDSLVADGIFGADIPLNGPVGFYRVDVRGTVSSDSSSFVDATSFELSTFQDLAMDSTLTFSKNLITAGDSVLVSATVWNLGNDAVQNVKIEFWDNETMFAVDSLDLAGNGSALVQAQFVAASPDSHTIRVSVYPFTLPSEAEYENNTTTKLVVLGVPVGVGDRLQLHQFSLTPPQPNPFSGNVTFRFSIPTSTPVSFEIYDLLGRRIKSWKWNNLLAGEHVITWDGRAVDGILSTPGLYFVKCTAGRKTMNQKIVRLR